MFDWNPNQYLRFGNERAQPAVDLMARIYLDNPKRVYDLGCGSGNITLMLKQKWPTAEVTGVDNSKTMLGKARALSTDITWKEIDLNNWQPDEPCDLLYSNAVFQWLDNHQVLFPRLLETLKPGGTLAVQMPRNFNEPTHTCLTSTIHNGSWKEKLEPYIRGNPVEEASHYYEMLAPRSSAIDIWETT